MAIKLLVGLGNPGPEYEATRHNAGFWWIDELAHRWGARLAHDRNYHGLVARVNSPMPGVDGPVWLLQPQTYMNLSGKSVAALARFFKIQSEEILVVHDELDVVPGHQRETDEDRRLHRAGHRDRRVDPRQPERAPVDRQGEKRHPRPHRQTRSLNDVGIEDRQHHEMVEMRRRR